jgi:hypothetical protein
MGVTAFVGAQFLASATAAKNGRDESRPYVGTHV